MHVVLIIILIVLVLALLLGVVGYLLMVLLASTPALLASGILLPSVTYGFRSWRLERARRSERLADYVQVGLESASYRLSLSSRTDPGSRSHQDLQIHNMIVAITCAVLLAVPYVLYKTGSFRQVTFFDSPANEGVSWFFSSVMTGIAIGYLFHWTRESRSPSLFENEARKTLSALNEYLAGVSRPLTALAASIRESGRQLGVSLPDPTRERLAGFVQSHGLQTLAAPDSLRRHVGELQRDAQLLDGTLRELARRRDQVQSQLRRTATAVNRSSVASFIHEFEDHDQAFNSDSFVEVVAQGDWAMARQYLDVLFQALQGLEARAEAGPGDREQSASRPGEGAVTDEDEARRILPVPPSASREEIKRVYKALVATWHSDKTKDESMLRRLNQAYQLLRSRA